MLAFLTELAALAVLAGWGAHIVRGGWRWGLALAAPLAFAVVWGLYLSPRAPIQLPLVGRRTLMGLAFAMAVWAAVSVWGWRVAGPFALAAALSLLGDTAQASAGQGLSAVANGR